MQPVLPQVHDAFGTELLGEETFRLVVTIPDYEGRALFGGEYLLYFLCKPLVDIHC